MHSWKDLRQEFSVLISLAPQASIQCQWGEIEEQFHPGGFGSGGALIQFKSLAEAAGNKLLEIPGAEGILPEEVFNESNPTRRWYKAIWHIEGGMEVGFPFQGMEGEKVLWTAFSGRITNPIERSMALAMRLGSVDSEVPAQETNIHVSGNNPRFNLNSIDNSTNVVQDSAEVFQTLRDLIQNGIPEGPRERVLNAAIEMEQAHGKPTFREKYLAFMSVASDHIGVLTPILIGLGQLL